MKFILFLTVLILSSSLVMASTAPAEHVRRDAQAEVTLRQSVDQLEQAVHIVEQRSVRLSTQTKIMQGCWIGTSLIVSVVCGSVLFQDTAQSTRDIVALTGLIGYSAVQAARSAALLARS